jgi:DHA2 family multidrug resistance protein-like MFS transporter
MTPPPDASPPTQAAGRGLRPDGLPWPQRFWAILTVAIAITMSVLDSSIANIALPTIAQDLGASPADSIWVVNAYQLAVTILLLPLASLGDIHGYRRIYSVGLAVFTLASLGCALSHSLAVLSVARVVQGAGAAGIMSVNAALVRFIYPRDQLGRGIGINALVVAGSAAVGPTVAAAILAAASWPWLFAINLPLGVFAFWLALRALPPNRRSHHRFDFLSAILSALTFGPLITGIDGFGHGERGGAAAAQLATALLFAALFVWRQLRLPFPMLPVDLFRRPVFSLSVATSISSFVAQGLAFVSLPFYFENVLGLTQVETGLLMTPWPLAVGVAAPVAGRLADRYSAGILGGVGLVALSLGLAAVAALPTGPSPFDIAWRMALCGVGFGLFQTPNNRALITAAPRERSGGAGGVLSMARLLGQTTGAALVALVFGLVAGGPETAKYAETIAVAAGAAFAALGAAASLMRLVDFRRTETE